MVFQPGHIKRGAFIEDKIGNVMLDDLRLRGAEAHSTYATWILDDACMEPMVKHAHGRAFLTEELRRVRIDLSLGEKTRAEKASSVKSCCSGGHVQVQGRGSGSGTGTAHSSGERSGGDGDSSDDGESSEAPLC